MAKERYRIQSISSKIKVVDSFSSKEILSVIGELITDVEKYVKYLNALIVKGVKHPHEKFTYEESKKVTPKKKVKKG